MIIFPPALMDQIIMGALVSRPRGCEKADSKLMEPPSASPLLACPQELKLQIVSYLPLKRDIYNLSRTCRGLEDVVLERLYSNVSVTIPRQNSPDWQSGSYFTPRPYTSRALRHLTLGGASPDSQRLKFSCKWCLNADNAVSYATQMIRQVPANQLKSLSLMHGSAITQAMFDDLTELHQSSLSQLRFYEMDTLESKLSNVPTNLEELECRSIQDGEALGHLAAQNKDTLRRLHLGQERELFEQYRRIRTSLPDQPLRTLMNFKTALGGELSTLPSLRSLTLVGLDVSPIIPTSVETAVFFTSLTSLNIKSCSRSEEFLSRLAETFDYVQHSEEDPARPSRVSPKLRSFRFRDESPRASLKEALLSFLESFSGLQSLSILIENASFLERPARLIAGHGPSLQRLALETRIQPREQLALDTSRPFGMGNYSSQLWEEAINDICRLCPNLIELGMGFPWNDEMVRLRKSMLSTLQHLKTIHIRNFPESQMRLQVGDYSIKEYATKFMDWTYGSATSSSLDSSSEPPKVETLSIGPTLYETRFKGCTAAATTSAAAEREVPEFLRTHHFAVDWAQTRFGRWSPMVTNVSERYMEEIREETPLSGVFDNIWLR